MCLESALCYSELPTSLSLPRIKDIQSKLPNVSSLLIDCIHDYLGDITTNNLRGFDFTVACCEDDCFGCGMEGKISVQCGFGPTDFYFFVENRQQMGFDAYKPRSIGPRYKVNPETP